jgi:hypothetical protein
MKLSTENIRHRKISANELMISNELNYQIHGYELKRQLLTKSNVNYNPDNYSEGEESICLHCVYCTLQVHNEFHKKLNISIHNLQHVENSASLVHTIQ